jgi:phosphohistidine phosphatase
MREASSVTKRRLYLLRHAKSSWKEAGLADHERPLSGRGRRAVKAMRRHLRAQKVEPDLVLCSTATRARQTLEGIEPSLRRGATRVEDALYGASPAELLARLHEIEPRVRSVMVIGHNPGLEELALLLARDGSKVGAKFPTGALATLEFSGAGWDALDRGTAELIEFVRPRDLES